MRVLHVVATGQRRGAEVFAADLVRALGECSVEQHVVLLRGGEPAVAFEAPVELARAERLLPGVRMDMRSISVLRARVTRWRPDVVQVQGGESLKYALAARALGDTPVVYRRIGMSDGLGERRLRRATYAVLMRRAQRIVAVSDAVRDETIALFGVAPGRIVTIPTGRDARRLDGPVTKEAVRYGLGIPTEAPLLLWAGALSAEKGPLACVELARRVADSRPGTVTLMAGDGPMRSEVSQMVEAGGLGGTVRLLGSRGDISDLMHAADALVLTSRTEGMPGILIEAGMTGLPVAAYAVGGVGEIVADGVTGALVPPGDLDGLARAVAGLLASPRTLATMGQAARARCRERFDMPAIAARYMKLYRDLLGAA